MRYTTLFAILALPMLAQAQGLDVTETVDQVIMPAQQAAQRQNQLPALSAYTGAKPSISFAEYAGTATLTRTVAFNEPLPWADSITPSPYRGYAAIGYFPSYNLGATAGYRLVNAERTQVGAWLEYTGRSYKDKDWLDASLSQNSFTVNINARQRFRQRNFLTGNVDFTYFDASTPWLAPTTFDSDMPKTNSKKFNLWLDWDSKQARSQYQIRFNYGLMALGANEALEKAVMPYFIESTGLDHVDPITEQLFKLQFTGELNRGTFSNWGLNVESENGVTKAQKEDETVYKGIHTLNPYYAIRGGNFSAKVGLRFAFSVLKSHCTGLLSPDIELAWTPSQWLGIHAEASGHYDYNSLQTLQQRLDGYLLPYTAYIATRNKLVVGGGITLGMWRGLSATLDFHYGISEGCMPTLVHEGDLWLPTFNYGSVSGDLKGALFEAKVNYEAPRWVKVRAGFALASKTNDPYDPKGWYEWYDHANRQISAGVTVTPLPRLNIDIDYLYRGDRQLIISDYTEESWGNGYEFVSKPLKSINQLNLGVSYAITDASRNLTTGTFAPPALTVFANIDNLLARRWYNLAGVPAQGVHGRIGVALKF